MISWRAEFYNSVFDATFTLRVRIYRSLSGFRRAYRRETGNRCPDRMHGCAGQFESGEYQICIHEKFLGAGCVSHEALHIAFNVYRNLSGSERISFAPSEALAKTDRFDYKEYVEHPEECICDILEVIVKDFWNKWNERTC